MKIFDRHILVIIISLSVILNAGLVVTISNGRLINSIGDDEEKIIELNNSMDSLLLKCEYLVDSSGIYPVLPFASKDAVNPSADKNLTALYESTQSTFNDLIKISKKESPLKLKVLKLIIEQAWKDHTKNNISDDEFILLCKEKRNEAFQIFNY